MNNPTATPENPTNGQNADPKAEKNAATQNTEDNDTTTETAEEDTDTEVA